MKLDVIKYRRIYLTFSAAVIVAGLIAMFISWQTFGSPLRLAIDFTGGTRLTLELICEQPTDVNNAGNPTNTANNLSKKCGQPIDIKAVREAIAAKGYGNSVIQLVGNEQRGLSIQTGDLDVAERSQLQASLETALNKFGKVDPKSSQIEQVGPVIGQQVLTSGLAALGLSFIGIAVYLTIRFQPDYAFFAILALLHDVFVTAGFFAILGLTIGVDIDSLFIVAMLTIVGFSVNDTVVIYDRVRENINLLGENHDINDLVNISVNQTLARSINTTMTTLLSLVAIFFFGGSTLKFFALALIIGFASGAYSSIFNASILLAWWRSRAKAANKPSEAT